MKLRRLSHRGSPAFRHAVATLDLDAIKGRLIGVTGPNGVGKTCFLGGWIGAMYGTVPTRGTILDLARVAGSRDAFWTATVELPEGTRTFTHSVDGVSEKQEVSVTDEAGAKVLDSTSVKAYRAGWMAEHLLPLDVVTSTQFVAQSSQGWVDLGPADRRGVVLRAIGADGYERRSSAALKKATEVRNALDAAQSRLTDAKERAVSVATAESTAADAMPEPDLQTGDGTPVYSAPQLQKWQEWNTRKLTADMQAQFRKELGPVHEVISAHESAKATATITTVLTEMRADADFKAHEADIKATLQQDAKLWALADSDPKLALELAWARVYRAKVLPRHDETLKAEVVANLQQRAVSGTTNPGSATTSAPPNMIGNARAALQYADSVVGAA